MAFKYNPKDAQKPVWPKGEYNAVLVATEEKVSKAGNPMQVLSFDVYDGDRSTQVDDYIVDPTTIYKLKMFAKALGELAAFDAGTFNADEFKGVNVLVELDIQSGTGGFDDSNKIKKYRSKESAGAPNATAADPLKNNARRIPAGTTIDAEDIPF